MHANKSLGRDDDRAEFLQRAGSGQAWRFLCSLIRLKHIRIGEAFINQLASAAGNARIAFNDADIGSSSKFDGA
jgi:hypothetical protein